MAIVKILIVEDEVLTAEDLSNRLKEAGYLITAVVDNGNDALRSAKSDPPDMIFMDINITGEDDGIETTKKLKLLDDFPVIFLTNIYDNKTIQRARAVKPANYLVKPFTINQLLVSLETALFNASMHQAPELQQNLSPIPENDLSILKDKFFIRNKTGAFHRYMISDILYLEAERSYCKIHLSNGENLMQALSMKDIQAKIDHPHFVRASRSYVVNLDRIDAIKGNLIIINGGHEIKMGKEYIDSILQHLKIVR